jgi:hypothetical protein
MSEDNLEPIEMNPFVLASIVTNGSWPSVQEGQTAQFLTLYTGIGQVPIEVLGIISPVVAPFLIKQFPWLENIEDRMPSEEQWDDDSTWKENNTFAGYREYMNLVFDEMQKIVDEHGETVLVQPLTQAERQDLMTALIEARPSL